MSLALQSIFALILKFSELLLNFSSLQVWRTSHALHLLSLQWFTVVADEPFSLSENLRELKVSLNSVVVFCC